MRRTVPALPIPRAGAGLVLAALLAAACGSGTGTDVAPTAPPNQLTITGPLRADPASEKGAPACTWKPSDFVVTFTSGSLGGTTVAFTVVESVGGVGDASATTPALANGDTPLVLRNGGTTIRARSGTISTASADIGAYLFKGTIDADMADGSHVSGSWACVAKLASA